MASTVVVLLFLLFAFVYQVSGNTCVNPQIATQTYTTTDATVVVNIAFIAEFTVSCKNDIKNLNLYADVGGKIVPVSKSQDGSKYQISWTEDPKKVSSGDYPVSVYDEEGFAALRKAQRIGDDTSNISPLFILTVNHQGTYTGPWVQSEFLAAVAAVLIWYTAYSAKSKLQA